MAVNTTAVPSRGARSTTARAAHSRSAQQHPSDDEILGLVTAVAKPAPPPDDASSASAASGANPPAETAASTSAPPALSARATKALEAHPELQQAFAEAQAYRSVFATPEAARDAKAQLDDLDAMFFSAQPADHAALAAHMHELSPAAFHGLAQAMHAHSAKLAAANANPPAALTQTTAAATTGTVNASAPATTAAAHVNAPPAAQAASQTPPAVPVPTPGAAAPVAPANPAQPFVDPQRAAKIAFFHSTNAAAVQQIIGAIQSQVEHLLPQSVSAATRTRIVGEIYREIDATLRANRQLGQQLRDAFQGGTGDAAHQRAIVALLSGRAKQALPAIAKRVIGEWTGSVVAANRERLSRHESAAKRVDIAGASPSDGVNRKPLSPRDVDYKRLSDADILNL
ncbi:MAG TPA: hypothetical protein VGR81_00485 [Candidatus Acidoferrales bacterium]|nr:hypothetical protein [Candidatus Acidoferrales bacterium]